MNYLNLSAADLDSDHFIGAEPTDRATWICLQRYCIGQENGGRIEGCRKWADRKWQQLVRITKEEAMRESELWEWDGDSLVVWHYPADKEAEVKAKREVAKNNGAKGGRPAKTNVGYDEKPTSVNSAKAAKTNVGYDEKPTSVNSAKAEENRKEEKGIGKEEKEESPTPFDENLKPLCTLQQARSHAGMVNLTEKEAEHWWHARNSAGWTKGSAGGGARSRISSWQSDMAASASWAKEGAAKNGKSKFKGMEENIPLV